MWLRTDPLDALDASDDVHKIVRDDEVVETFAVDVFANEFVLRIHADGIFKVHRDKEKNALSNRGHPCKTYPVRDAIWD